VRYFLSCNMLIGCFFWAEILGACVILGPIPSTTVLFDNKAQTEAQWAMSNLVVDSCICVCVGGEGAPYIVTGL